jgi:hypothetical protein
MTARQTPLEALTALVNLIVDLAQPEHRRDVRDLVLDAIRFVEAEASRPVPDADLVAAGKRAGIKEGIRQGFAAGLAEAEKRRPAPPPAKQASVVVVERDAVTGRPVGLTEDSDGLITRKRIEYDADGRLVRVVAATEAP